MEVFGWLAATAVVVGYLPQAWRIARTRHTVDISLSAYILIVFGSVCWVVYGIGTANYTIIVPNVIVMILSGVILAIKAVNTFKDRH